MSAGDWLAKLRPYTGVIALVVLCAAFGMRNPRFLSPENVPNLLNGMAIIGILAVGQAFPLIGGGFDLSQGAIAGLCGSVTAWLLSSKGMPVPAAMAIGISLGALLGTINGVLVAVVKINPFVATLGTQLLFFGLTTGLFNAQPLSLGPQAETIQQLNYGQVGPFSYASLIFLSLVLALWFVLRLLPFGQHVYTLGGNEEATRLAGIDTVALKIKTYALSGLMAALGGMILMAKSGQATPTAGTGYEFQSLASCIVGGIALGGGVGAAWNVLLGAATLQVIDNGLQMANFSPNWRVMIQGFIILMAVTIDARARLRR